MVTGAALALGAGGLIAGQRQARKQSKAQQRTFQAQDVAFQEQQSDLEKQQAEARARSQARAGQIESNVGLVQQAFDPLAGSLGGQTEEAALSFLQPQLQQQFETAQRGLTTGLARQGLLDSSVGARSAGRLQETLESGRQDVIERSRAAGEQARGRVEQARGIAIQQARAGTGLENIQSVIQPQIAPLSVQSDFSPLGDIFGGLASQFGTSQLAQQAGFPGSRIFDPRRLAGLAQLTGTERIIR